MFARQQWRFSISRSGGTIIGEREELVVETEANSGGSDAMEAFDLVVRLYVSEGLSVSSSTPTDIHVDLSWQMTLQKLWESLSPGKKVEMQRVQS
ncbi:hypothetical protein PHJA_001065700 [Phtheirospermum japonicum]|uniref:Uncharacterized protein n=1 Tax=Phtheirospermum japonicum TaxID=374723 RepID=A0A830BNU7_9LAMI|nr:hypothetical protein PHJA_001065700 [Phtheirospermum japonicum]